MNKLTKAEEQVMQYLWQIEKGFLKDILELFPEPKPHTNTISTILKILMEKGFQQLQLMQQIRHRDVFWITVFYVMIQQMKMEWRSEIRRKRH